MAIDIRRDGVIGIITINRPEALNAFNSDQLASLQEALDELSADDGIRVVILTGAGEKAFAAGADIAEMKDKSPEEGLVFSQFGHKVCRTIETMPKPVIAAVNGFALGGGCELALACDVRIASENAVLGQPEVGLGIPPGWGATQRLARVVGDGIARELIFTGRRVKADEARSIGLVNVVHPFAQLMDEALALANQIAANGPLAVARSKAAINRSYEFGLEAGQEYEAQAFALSFATSDQREGMGAFLDRRTPEFTGN